MNGVLHLQDFSQIELLKALMDLQKDMVVMLLSMLEGRRIIKSILILPNVNILISVCFTFCWIVCWIHKQNCASHQLWTRIGIYMNRNSPLHQPKSEVRSKSCSVNESYSQFEHVKSNHLYLYCAVSKQLHGLKQESKRIIYADFKNDANPKLCYKAVVARQ